MQQLFLVRYPEEPIAIPSKGKTAIGRSEGNDIILTEPRVSRKHAAIGWMRFQRAYSISDLGSSNGTFLNGSRITAYHACFLHDWDKIRIASAVFTVRIVDTPSIILDEFKELQSRTACNVTQIAHVDELESPMPTPGLSGDLSHLCPVELFQMLEAGNKTGTLTLKTKQGEGFFSFSGGKVASASFNDILGEQAVYASLGCTEGAFTFNPQEITVEFPDKVLNTTYLLIEGCRLLDEEAKK